jgi:uncharacterized protein (TIGR00290 family)
MKQKLVLAWSSGKDSALSLHALRRRDDVEVIALLTTISREGDWVPMHRVPRDLVERQAEAAGLPLEVVYIESGANNIAYEAAMGAALQTLRAQGVTGVAFGDLFLEEVRAFRERQLAKVGMDAVFPLWHTPTDELARQFIAECFQAVITSIDTNQMPADFLGHAYDAAFLGKLPKNADPCGENGEFHTFVHAGPIFSQGIPFVLDGAEIEGPFHRCALCAA